MQPGESQSSETFRSFQLPRKEMHDLDITRYRVYSTLHEYVIIIADSAAEAMQRARFVSPYKVVREFPLYRTLLSPDWIGLGDEEATDIVKNVPSSIVPDEPLLEISAAPETDKLLQDQPTAAVEPEAKLSQDEINKLLEG